MRSEAVDRDGPERVAAAVVLAGCLAGGACLATVVLPLVIAVPVALILIACAGLVVRQLAGRLQTGLAAVRVELSAAAIDAEARIEDAGTLAEAILYEANDGILTIDDQGVIETVNPIGEQVFGFPSYDLVGEHIGVLMPETFRRGTASVLDGFRVNEDDRALGMTYETRGLRQDGAVIPVELAVRQVLLENHRLYVVFVRDITVQKEAQAEARKVRAIVQDSNDAILVHDFRGRILAWNRGAERMYGYSEAEAKQQNVRELMPVASRDSAMHYLGALDRGETVLTRESERVTKDGRLVYILLTASVLFDDQGQPDAITTTERDITAAKQSEAQLRDALAAAEVATRSKSEFLANMSHEIRTPMTAIIGFAELLAETTLSAEQSSRIASIRRNGSHLLDIINDILDISKVEAGKMFIERITVPLLPLLADVQALMKHRADEQGIAFELEFEGPIPVTISTDPTRLRQVLINLCGNAIKFTRHGSVRLVASLDNAADSASLIVFDIIDTGVGMTPEQAAKLFQPFTQADSSTTRNYGGTGLGLTISRHLAELLGGVAEIVDSHPGQGSHFRITVQSGDLELTELISDPGAIRRQLTPKSKQTQKQRVSTLACKVLLAEDGRDNQALLRAILTPAGVELTMVENGALAVAAALDEAAEFDVILMDMQMPVMDGYTATTTLRERGYTGPIIALTANAMDGDRKKCIDVGCDEFATKPIDRRALLAMLQRFAVTEPPRGACDPGS